VADKKEPKKPPFALVKQDAPEKVVAWVCGECGVVAGSTITHGDGAKLMAEKHCGSWLCVDCGAEHDRHYQDRCNKCWTAHHSKIQVKKEAAMFADAEHVAAEDWDGPVYTDASNYNEGFFRDLDDLYDNIEEDERPSYVWTCTTMHPSLDAEALLESALEETHEDCELDATDELKDFIDRWNDQQTAETWWADHKKAVVL
jgi:hypothetical protein